MLEEIEELTATETRLLVETALGYLSAKDQAAAILAAIPDDSDRSELVAALQTGEPE
jgi:hypothetical protein